jgi:hypothetical protein
MKRFARFRQFLTVALGASLAVILAVLLVAFIYGPVRRELTVGKPVSYSGAYVSISGNGIQLQTELPKYIHPGDSTLFTIRTTSVQSYRVKHSTLSTGGRTIYSFPIRAGSKTCRLLAPSSFDSVDLSPDEFTTDGIVCRWAIVPKNSGNEIVAYNLLVGRMRIVGMRAIEVEEPPWSLDRLSAIAGLLTAAVAILLKWQKPNIAPES